MNELVVINEENEILVNAESVEKIKELNKKILELEMINKEVKLLLKNAFEITGKTSILLDGFSATYKKPSVRTSIDTKRLKEELPEVYNEYSKITEVSGSVTIKVE